MEFLVVILNLTYDDLPRSCDFKLMELGCATVSLTAHFKSTSFNQLFSRLHVLALDVLTINVGDFNNWLVHVFRCRETNDPLIWHAAGREDPLGGASALQVHHGDGSHHSYGGDVTVSLAWLRVQHHNILILTCVVRNL